ncbi:MAG: hypothetical protein LBV08_07890, partial [Clostridiales bacterium]|nr:hypothetical protein [Clostridiales bacterium]
VDEEIGEPIKIHKTSHKIKNSKKDEKDSSGSEEDLDIIGIVPYFINIMTCRNDLDLEDIGNYAQVYAATEVYPGNYAGVKIELQQMYPYGWRTIKTWDKWEKTDYFSVEANWVVSRSFQYRTKNTHTARTSTGAITDTAISYSYILAF